MICKNSGEAQSDGAFEPLKSHHPVKRSAGHVASVAILAAEESQPWPILATHVPYRLLWYDNLGDHDLKHTLDLGVNRIRGVEQHRNSPLGSYAEGHLELIPGQVRALDPEVAAELPVAGFDVAL
jgi:hypothetical protein